ncbi:Sister chromatid cohesion protein Dcc [Parasponia andersonii]|uniref:Sister chromatid cohesion protein Dcc n=1 Tax=Parasponia andersonii TaxID=3476 RepID=A0A2P5C6T2_PARAD|nr:Sister chromatid cohesion protein Dcc [Parasponia andersonii]
MEPAYSDCRGAEAVLNLQPSASVTISYHPLFGSHDDIMLLELDEKFLPDILNQRVVVRGQPDEDAVLCTQSKTYAIKFVGTSNSVFLIPPSDSEFLDSTIDCDQKDQSQLAVASVIKVAPGFMELVEVGPKLDKLKYLLFKNPYSSEEDIEMEDLGDIERGLYKWDDLVERIQASDDELRSGLQALSALEIDGYWRVVDEKYMDMMLRMLLHDSVLNDWSLDALDQDTVVQVLQSDGYPCKLAEHCLCFFGQKLNESVDRSCVWKLDERKVCVHIAKQILRGGKRKMESFIEEWKQKIPEGMQVSFNMLEGEVLTERLGVDTWVQAFSLSSLPSTPAERFSILFKERQKWEWKDLQPYIRDLTAPGLSSEGLLLKYTRRTQPKADAEPVFSAR